jgi:transmembrane sensor
VFDSRDPITALEAVVHPHGGRVRRITPWLTVVAPI